MTVQIVIECDECREIGDFDAEQAAVSWREFFCSDIDTLRSEFVSF